MLKRVLPFLAVATLLLAACQPASSSVSEEPMEGCTVTGLLPTPDPTLEAAIPPVQPDDHVLGKADATITIVEYSDYQCPYCAILAPVLPQLVEKYPDDVRVVFRYFPLNIHTYSTLAAQAVEAASLQGEFIKMDEAVFAHQDQWSLGTEDEAMTWFLDTGAALGMDRAKLEGDMQSDAVKQRVDRNLQEATVAQLPGTPFLFINNLPYQADMSLEGLSSIVELFKLEARQYTSCPPMIINTAKQYQATLKTEKGDVVIQLYADKAPLAVNSFVFLARAGWFDGVTFHRVLPGFVAQTGDPSGSGYGGPGYQFKVENTDAKFDRAGLVAMANSGGDTNGSQFFITYDAAENLDGSYTIFGEVVQGMDVVEQLTARDPQTDTDLPQGDQVLSVSITES